MFLGNSDSINSHHLRSLRTPIILQCLHLRNHSLQIFHLSFFIIIIQARWGVCIIFVKLQMLYLQKNDYSWLLYLRDECRMLSSCGYVTFVVHNFFCPFCLQFFQMEDLTLASARTWWFSVLKYSCVMEKLIHKNCWFIWINWWNVFPLTIPYSSLHMVVGRCVFQVDQLY